MYRLKETQNEARVIRMRYHTEFRGLGLVEPPEKKPRITTSTRTRIQNAKQPIGWLWNNLNAHSCDCGKDFASVSGLEICSCYHDMRCVIQPEA